VRSLILSRTDVRRERAAVPRYSDMKDQIRGKAEEIKGKATGDKGEEAKGKARQAVGNLKRVARDVRGDLRAEADRTVREQDRAGLPRSR
jgi:uncharacterized protein YjbJ (UPF0337 family)